MKLKIDGIDHTLREFNLEEWRLKTPKPRVVTPRGIDVKDLSYLPSCRKTQFSLVGTINGRRCSWNSEGKAVSSGILADMIGYGDLYFAEPEKSERRLLTVKEIVKLRGLEMYVRFGADEIRIVTSMRPESNLLSYPGVVSDSGQVVSKVNPWTLKLRGAVWSDGATEPGKGVIWYDFEANVCGDEIELIEVQQ